MIRSIILWFARRVLAKYVSAAVAGRIVEAASAAYDEIKAKGGGAVMTDGNGVATTPFVILSVEPKDAEGWTKTGKKTFDDRLDPKG